MNLKNAVSAMQKEHSKDTLTPLYTPWGEAIEKEQETNVLPEYPRPQLRRSNYQMLNGKWHYAINQNPAASETFSADGEILVPFSPEALLSGVHRQVLPGDYLWYERRLTFSQEELSFLHQGKHCLLHFGAIDQIAVIYINGKEVASHVGGYLPFEVDITPYLTDSSVTLQIRVQDYSDTSYYSRGKQTLKRGGMFYTAQSGIWQSVWYEWVPANYISRLTITPDIDTRQVQITLHSPAPFSQISWQLLEATCSYNIEQETACPEISFTYEKTDATTFTLTIPQESVRLWTPETPYLYQLTITADGDTVHTYFAMRSYTIEPDENQIPRFCLNHQPYFLNGLLDQGYWSDGLMTAPADEALIFDITLARKKGFTMLRKHIKIEPLRWYYHCDRLGMIVCQDMVNGGSSYCMPFVCYLPTLLPFTAHRIKDCHYSLFARQSQEGRTLWEQECMDTITHLYNIPSLAMWVPFNEGWGQFDAARITRQIKEKDTTRPVDHASGWFDQKSGDFISIHNYFRPLKVPHPADGRAILISEYGGYACHIADHSSVTHSYGYRKYDDTDTLSAAVHTLFHKQLLPLVPKGLSGAVYTQLSDVEEEVNGLVTYDRRVIKVI